MEIPQQYPIVNEMYEAAAKESNGGRHYLGMSEIGKSCSRALWLSFRGYTPSAIEGKAKMIFSLGNCVEDEVIKWLDLAGYKVTDRQREFLEVNGYFRGHWDGCIEGISSKPHVLEIKSANDSRFKSYQNLGVKAVSPEYYAQVQCYMGYSGLKRALFVIMNKNNCDLYTERVYYSKEDFVALEEKAKDIIGRVFPPEPLPEDRPVCEYCRFKFICRQAEGYVQKQRTCGTCIECIPKQMSMLCTRYQQTIKKWGMACPEWKFALPDADRVPF